MLSLLVLSISSLFVLHLLSERQLISQVGAYTEDLSTTIQIAQEQPTTVGDPKDVLKAYAEKLTQLGVKDVSVADAADEVQASTNPQNVGKRLVRVAKKRGKEWVIRGVLGEESGPPGSQRTSTLTIPIVVGDRRVGYLLITRILDDFSALAKSALVTRVFATFGVFAVGILLSLFLSSSFSRPIQDLTQAAQRVAAGDLAAAVPPGGGDEMGSLTRAFNEMVERLRENKQPRGASSLRRTLDGDGASGLGRGPRDPQSPELHQPLHRPRPRKAWRRRTPRAARASTPSSAT